MDAETTPARRTNRFVTWPDAGLAIIVVLHVALIWWTPHFPTQDGPAHLHNADVLLRLSDPESPVFREFYELNPSPSPNWLGHVVLAALLAVFPPTAAEKAFLSVYAIAFALAVRYALRSTRADATPLVLLATPFILSWHLHMGFYNFCIGVALWCVAFGFWLRRRGLHGARQVCFFSVLCICSTRVIRLRSWPSVSRWGRPRSGPSPRIA